MAVSWNNEEERRRLLAEAATPLDHDVFAKKVANKQVTYYIGVFSRMGFGALAALVEYTIFHPIVGPISNDDYHYHIIELDKIPFMIFGVPIRFERKVVKYAEAIHMRVARTIPMLIGSEGPQYFPGSREAQKGRYNLYTIENGKGSQIYLNRPDLNAGIRKREKEIMDILMRYGNQVNIEAVRDYLWGFDHPSGAPPN